jgi:DNA-binding transcriptional MerR regulator
MTVLQFPATAKTIPGGHVTSTDLCIRAKVSVRQVDYWTRTGILTCLEATPGSGIVRAYPASEVTFARLLKQLLEGGMNLRAAVNLARELLEHGHADLAGIRIDLPQDL